MVVITQKTRTRSHFLLNLNFKEKFNSVQIAGDRHPAGHAHDIRLQNKKHFEFKMVQLKRQKNTNLPVVIWRASSGSSHN